MEDRSDKEVFLSPIDGPEQRAMCFTCPLPECVNCLDRGNIHKRNPSYEKFAKQVDRTEEVRAYFLAHKKASISQAATRLDVSIPRVRRIRDQMIAEGILKRKQWGARP